MAGVNGLVRGRGAITTANLGNSTFFGSGFNSPLSPFAWPRTSGMCSPPVQCCCKMWNIAPGDMRSLIWDWRDWDELSEGYSLYQVESATLLDMTTGSRPMPADPDMIKVTSGVNGQDPLIPDNEDVKSLVHILPQANAIEVLLDVAPDAPLGAQFKLSVCMIACNGCEGRKVRRCDCYVITLLQC